MLKMLNRHLEHIKVNGFKSIKVLDMEMNAINILIGANGAGKSNFISIFSFLNNLSRGKLQSYISKQGGTGRLLHFGAKETSFMRISLHIGIVDYCVSFTPNLNQDSLLIEDEIIDLGSDRINLQHTKKESALSITPATPKIVIDERTKVFLDQCRVYHFFDTSDYAGFKAMHKVSNCHYLEKDGANLAPFLYSLKKSEIEQYRLAYYQIVTAIKSVAPFFHDFYLEPDGEGPNANIILRWEHSEHDVPLSASMLSDGTARFICLATLIRQPEDMMPSTVILDEPELGLHPDSIAVLAEMIKNVSNRTQFIISTQSVELANYFKPEDFIVVEEIKGSSSFRRLEKEPLEVWLEEFRMGELWTRNLIGGNPTC